MRLCDVENGMAIHVSGQFFLDRVNSARRYVVIRMFDPMNPTGDAEDYRVFRYAEKPESFPDDNWIELED